MSRYRLLPTPDQEAGLLEHARHARFVWNLAVEQQACWRPGRASPPRYNEQARQLTEARAEFAWLRAGSAAVQQQALRVRFRWSRAVPEGVKSYRVTLDRASRWHVAFASVPDPIPAPGNGVAVGVDRGVARSAALSTGEMRTTPGLRYGEEKRLRRLQRMLARCERGSTRRAKVKAAIARLKAREVDRRKDWVEKTTTDLARRFDVIRVEDLNIAAMIRSAKGTRDAHGVNVRQKAGLNRGILANCWGRLVTRLQDKAPGRIEKVKAAYTSQTCSVCGHCAPDSRKSQAVFRCVACGHQINADVNAARNIAAGRAVTARRDLGSSRSAKREPQLATSVT